MRTVKWEKRIVHESVPLSLIFSAEEEGVCTALYADSKGNYLRIHVTENEVMHESNIA